MSDRSLRSLFPAPVLVAGGVLVAAAAYLTWLASDLWFWLDDWAFLLQRSVTGDSKLSLLAPHSDHWVTAPILVYRLLFSTVGLHHLPLALVTIALHLAVCILLAVMLRRGGADPWVWVLVMALMAFLGPGALDILWSFQMTFIGPAALGLAAMVAVDRGEVPPRLPLLAWGFLLIGLTFSGAGVVMVAWVAAYCLMRRGWLSALTLAALPAVVYVAWWLTHVRGRSISPHTPPERIVPFMLEGLGNIWDQVLPLPWLGPFMLLALVLAVAFGRLPPRLRMFAAAGLAGLLLDFLLLAVTRGGQGVDTSRSLRYLYIGVLLTLPAFGALLQLAWNALSRQPVVRGAVWAVLGALLVLAGSGDMFHVGRNLDDSTRGLEQRTVAASALVEAKAPLLSDEVDRVNAPGLDTTALARPDIRRALPHIRPGPQAVLDAAANLEVGVSSRPLAVDLGRCPDGAAGSRTVVLVPTRTSGSQVRLVVSGHRLVTSLRVGGRRSMGVTWHVEPGQPVYVGTTKEGATIQLRVRGGEVSACSESTGRDD